jgi:hypothetical protein
MGFEFINNSLGAVKQIQFELTPADLLLNSFQLPINPSKCYFFGGYIITQGGTIPLSAGSFGVVGNTTNLVFLRILVNGALGLNVLYKFNLQAAQVFTPQTSETYRLAWNYFLGDQSCKVIILYSEYL